MGQLLNSLNIPEDKQNKLVEDVFVVEEMVVAMGQFYQAMNDGASKDNLETTIVELIGDILTEVNQTK
jgi:hypothetical protein